MVAGLGALAALFLLVGYLIFRAASLPYQRQLEPPTTRTPSEYAADDLLHYWDTQAACYRLNADTLNHLYQLNPVEVREKLGRRDVEVTGVITSIEVGKMGGTYVNMDQVKCGFPIDRRRQFDGLRPGQQIAVRGMLGGQSVRSPELSDCRFVSR